MTTHKDRALEYIDYVQSWQEMEGGTKHANLANAILAQTEATLELADQQRLANIIALGRTLPGWIDDDEVSELLQLRRDY